MPANAFGKDNHLSRDFIGDLSHVTSTSVARIKFAAREGAQGVFHGPGWHWGRFYFRSLKFARLVG